MADELTELATLMLEAIKAKGDWVTRGEIAQAIGRHALTHYDLKLLNEMITDGLIEAEHRLVNVAKRQYFYRAK